MNAMEICIALGLKEYVKTMNEAEALLNIFANERGVEISNVSGDHLVSILALSEQELQMIFSRMIDQHWYRRGGFMCVPLVREGGVTNAHARSIICNSIRDIAVLYGVDDPRIKLHQHSWKWLFARIEMKQSGIDFTNASNHNTVNMNSASRNRWATLSWNIYTNWANRMSHIVQAYGTFSQNN